MSKNSRGFVPLLLIMGVVLVGIVGIGYFAIKNGQIKVNNNNLAVSSPTPTPQINETEDLPRDEVLRGWKTYRNEEYGFEFKYPLSLDYESRGPNLAQKQLNLGETISGTITPSFDTIVFIANDSQNPPREVFKVEIFHATKNPVSVESYDKNYLYLSGPCDLRWLNTRPNKVQVINRNGIDMLEVKVAETEKETYLGCYYFKSPENNLIVLSTSVFTSQQDFSEKDKMINRILSAFDFDDSQSQTVKLYFYKSSLDPNTDCLNSAVVPVEREIESSDDIITDTIKLLLKGATVEEGQRGFGSEFPYEGFYLISSELNNGILILEFPEIYSFTSGGSCRTGLLAAEVVKTAMQFDEVDSVLITPEGIFQP